MSLTGNQSDDVIYRTNSFATTNVVQAFNMSKVVRKGEVLTDVKPGTKLSYYITNESYAIPLLMEAAFWKAHGKNPVTIALNLTKDFSKSGESELKDILSSTNQMEYFFKLRKGSVDSLNNLKTTVGNDIASSTNIGQSIVTANGTDFVKFCSALVLAASYLGAGNPVALRETIDRINEIKTAYAANFSQLENQLTTKKDNESLFQGIIRNNERDELKKSYKTLQELADTASKFTTDDSPQITNKQKRLNALRSNKQKYVEGSEELKKKIENLEKLDTSRVELNKRASNFQKEKNLLEANIRQSEQTAQELASRLKESQEKSARIQQQINEIAQQQANLQTKNLSNLQKARQNLAAMKWDDTKDAAIAQLEKEIRHQKDLKQQLNQILPAMKNIENF